MGKHASKAGQLLRWTSDFYWHDSANAELTKMAIERKRLGDPSANHHRAAGTVSKAPAFVLESPKGLPSVLDISPGYPVNLGEGAGEGFK